MYQFIKTIDTCRHQLTLVETEMLMNLNQIPVLPMHPTCPYTIKGTKQTGLTSLANPLSHTGLGWNLATFD